jgi:hypothetical protein
VAPTAALLHHEHFSPLAVVVRQVFSEVTASHEVALSLAFWYSHWNTEEGRDLASDSVKQVPPTAALLHHEHFSAPLVPVMHDFSERPSQVVAFRADFWYSHWKMDEGRDLASGSSRQVPPTAALAHQEHLAVDELLDMHVFSLVTESQVVAVKAVAAWNWHWNTDEGRPLASDVLKQDPPTAALSHHEHFSPSAEVDIHVLLLVMLSQVEPEV